MRPTSREVQFLGHHNTVSEVVLQKNEIDICTHTQKGALWKMRTVCFITTRTRRGRSKRETDRKEKKRNERKRKTEEELHHRPLIFNHLNIRDGEAFKILPINFFASDYGVPSTHTHTLSLSSHFLTYIYHPSSATCPLTPKQTNRNLSLPIYF